MSDKPDPPPRASGPAARLRQWLWATLVVGPLALLFGAYATGLLNQFLWSPRELACEASGLFARAPQGTHFTILVAPLANDDDGSQTAHLLASLDAIAAQGGVAVRAACHPLALALKGDRQANLAAAEDEGRNRLKAASADVLVWGEVAKRDEVLRLRYLANGAGGSPFSSYRFNEVLELPKDFSADLGNALFGAALAAAAPATDQAGKYLVDRLQPVAARMEALVANPPAGVAAPRLALVRHTLGEVYLTMGAQTGSAQWLAKSVESYRAALAGRPRATMPLDWAATESSLGDALSAWGEREAGNARLEEAVAAYHAALEVRTRELAPLAWAATETNLGTVLSKWGAREGDAAPLGEAVAAYRAALEVRTRERTPRDWAVTQGDLGTALRRLAEKKGDADGLKQAADAYRAALEVLTRERYPLDWATLQNNLGNALESLGEMEDGTARLEEAAAAFRAALELRPRDRVPLSWAITQNNLGNALATIGERESGTANLEQAVEAYRSALAVFEAEQASYYLDGVRGNLAHAEALLKQRREAAPAKTPG